jgi:uncharacterized cupredoxin-like copper-binding protein
MKMTLIYLLLLSVVVFSQSEHKTIEIIMDDYSFEPKEIVIPAGEKTELKFINKGDAVHEFMAGKKITSNDEGYKEDLFEGVEVIKYINSKAVEGDNHKHDHHGIMIEIEPGEEGSLVFTLPESKKGEWDMGCFIEFGTKTHHDLGMHGKIIIK